MPSHLILASLPLVLVGAVILVQHLVVRLLLAAAWIAALVTGATGAAGVFHQMLQDRAARRAPRAFGPRWA